MPRVGSPQACVSVPAQPHASAAAAFEGCTQAALASVAELHDSFGELDWPTGGTVVRNYKNTELHNAFGELHKPQEFGLHLV